jgi:hypothetical protein
MRVPPRGWAPAEDASSLSSDNSTAKSETVPSLTGTFQ